MPDAPYQRSFLPPLLIATPSAAAWLPGLEKT